MTDKFKGYQNNEGVQAHIESLRQQQLWEQERQQQREAQEQQAGRAAGAARQPGPRQLVQQQSAWYRGQHAAQRLEDAHQAGRQAEAQPGLKPPATQAVMQQAGAVIAAVHRADARLLAQQQSEKLRQNQNDQRRREAEQQAVAAEAEARRAAANTRAMQQAVRQLCAQYSQQRP